MPSRNASAPDLTEADISRIIEMAWEDRTPFEAMAVQFGLNESAVVAHHHQHMKPSSFRMLRKTMARHVNNHALQRVSTLPRPRALHTLQT